MNTLQEIDEVEIVEECSVAFRFASFQKRTGFSWNVPWWQGPSIGAWIPTSRW